MGMGMGGVKERAKLLDNSPPFRTAEKRKKERNRKEENNDTLEVNLTLKCTIYLYVLILFLLR